MLISETDTIDGARIAHSIGRLKTTSVFRAADQPVVAAAWRERTLRDLIRRADDVDADAIVCLAFHVERAADTNKAGVILERVLAEGVAVRIARTA